MSMQIPPGHKQDYALQLSYSERPHNDEFTGDHAALSDGSSNDKGAAYHQERADQIAELTEEEKAIEIKLKRRLDLTIMPLVILVYLMNYIDRNNYPAARLQGLEKDLGLTPSQYELGLAILFVGYILGQVPSNLVLNKLGKPSLYLGFWTTAWGLVSACTSQVKTPGQIIACRFILGFVEAPFFAGVLFYLSKWYTKSELNLRMSIFYSGSLISGAFGNLIAAGILSGLNGKRGLHPWQWLYIIEGSVTTFIGLMIMIILPDFPHTWRLLSPEMKHVAQRRLAVDAAETDIDTPGWRSQWVGLKQAVADIKVWILAFAYMCITGAAGFQNFFPTLTKTLGYSNFISLLLVAPPYIFITFWSYGHSILSDRQGKRFWYFVYPIPVTIIGWLIFMLTKNFGARYFSFFLMIFVFAINGTCYSWIAGAIPRPPAKRAAAYALINSLGNSASVWTPFTYRPKDAPFYRPALGVCIALQVIAFLLAVWLRTILVRENKRLDHMARDDVRLSEAEVAKLKDTAQEEGVSLAEARTLQKGYRYII